jgi:hypothetical protein
VECAFDPERPRHLKRSEAGERAGVIGSAMPNASVTAPLFLRHAHPREDNRRSHHQGSCVEPMGCAADARRMTFREITTVTVKVQAMGHYSAAFRPVAVWVQTPKGFKFRGSRRRLAAVEQPKAGLVLEPVCPETASRALLDLTSRPATSKPDEKPRDFDGCESTLARNRTRRSPC